MIEIPPQFEIGMTRGEVCLAAYGLGPVERVQFWGTYESSVEIVYPSVATGNEIDDIAAVISGAKPATIVDGRQYFDPQVDALVTGNRDLFRQLHRDMAVDGYGDRLYFWGQEDNVTALAELYDGRGGAESARPNDDAFHQAVGEALGYSTEAIDAFLAYQPQIDVGVDVPARKGFWARLLHR